jgi:hypothetical protein
MQSEPKPARADAFSSREPASMIKTGAGYRSSAIAWTGLQNCLRKSFCRVAAKLEERKTSMKLFAASALAIGLGLLSVSAQAMPIAPVDKPATNEIRVAQGCGPGMHRGPGGMCRPLFSCPRGWHPGPHGRECFRN